MSGLRHWLDGYRRTLKGTELEEGLDLVFFRPLAYFLVRLLAKTPLTPDGVTRLAGTAGLAAGICFWQGTPAYDRWGAALFMFGNVLDCADGMLARLKGRGSPMGRIFDGVNDYLASIFVFIGIAHGLELKYEAAWPWALMVAAGVSLGWWCSVVDRMRLDWLHRVRGTRPAREAELSALIEQSERWRAAGGHRRERGLVALYALYWHLWDRLTPGRSGCPECDAVPAHLWAAFRRPILRMAVLLGPSMHLTALCVAAVCGHAEVYLWGTVILGNLWGVLVLAAAGIAERRLATLATAPADEAKVA